LSVVPQNRQREVGTRHTSRSGGLLHVKASLTRVSQSGLKTSGGVTAGGARGTITKVASRQVKDGWVNAMDYVPHKIHSFCALLLHLLEVLPHKIPLR
jgi:hypothetical protein